MQDINSILKQYFGYKEFRPLQREIILDILSGKDVFVLMPTGGGKSLCYQIPSLVQKGLTIVVSPLISLMKDQVDGLVQLGIKAAYLNSTLSVQEQESVKELLIGEKLSLLYVAPERLMQDQFIKFLRKLCINLFAIDEAHCISEWGHDFRQEYRSLNKLRSEFPRVPIATFTATATSRVKNDIITHLGLINLSQYKVSFNRPNLYYSVWKKQNSLDQLLEYLAKHKGESGIIYCQSRDKVDSIANYLQTAGLKALPYHAGLKDSERKEYQDRFIKEDADIIVATIAFGMGIDKPNVRFVIHYDLPSNLERYYQETGRAGRDGLDSKCILFYSYGDKRNIEYFIGQKKEQEQIIAYHLLKQMVIFAESRVCRRKILIEYFGEKWQVDNCRSCDNCLNPSEIFDATLIAQKILSCVYRLGQRFGIHYVSEVLRGSRNKKIMQFGYDKLSTYAILKEHSVSELKTYIQELVQLGYLQLNGEQYPILNLGSKSVLVLKKEEKVFLHKPRLSQRIIEHVESDVDYELFEKLRIFRKKLADEQKVPPYIIFSDVTLKDMTRFFPQNKEQFSNIKGVGEQKLNTYGEIFIAEITNYCNAKNIAPKNQANIRKKQKKQNSGLTINETLELYCQGLTIEEIAKERGLAISTIAGHLEEAYIKGANIDISKLVSEKKREIITSKFKELGMQKLSPVKEDLGEKYSYDELRWVRALLIDKSKGI